MRGEIFKIAVVCAALAMLALFVPSFVSAAEYVGSAVCSACHKGYYDTWEETLHRKSLRNITDPTSPDYQDPLDPRWGVIGDFTQDPTLSDPGHEIPPVTIDLNVSDGVYTAKIGEVEYQVVRTYGGGSGWKQRYVAKIEGSHYILPMQWNEKTGEWVEYHIRDWYDTNGNPKDIAKYQSFERRCAGCHNTGLQVSYDEATEEYTTTYSELNTACEVCHGPGSEHVAAGGGEVGIINPADLPTDRANEVCGQCHSRGESTAKIGPKNFGYPWHPEKGGFQPGEVLTDYYTDKGGYWPDGTSKKHHQQLEDFYKSPKPTFKFHEVRCYECHNPHGSVNKHDIVESIVEEVDGVEVVIATENDNNTLCLACHATHGPFEVLTKEMIADPVANRDAIAAVVAEHTHHSYDPEAGPSRCSKCHMPKVQKSAVHYDIHAHTFEPIPPEKTLLHQPEGGMPNSCAVSCHRDGKAGAPTFDIVDAKLSDWSEPSDVALAEKLLEYYGPEGKWWKVEVVTAVEVVYSEMVPESYSLSQNYPNPFNPITHIEYSIPEAGEVHLRIYNVLGQMVQELVDGHREPGSYVVVWDGVDLAGRDAASGIYLYRIEAKDFKATRKMLLVR